MSGCWQQSITDAAISHLRGIRKLNMSVCSQIAITDAALLHLRGIHTLSIAFCDGITGATFGALAGIASLTVSDDALYSLAKGMGLPVVPRIKDYD